MLTCDSICKIVVLAHNDSDKPFKDLKMEIQGGECDLTAPLSSAEKQVAAVFLAYAPGLTIPFPLRPENDKWTVIPYSTPIKCLEIENLAKRAKEIFIPFTANQIIVECKFH